MGGSLLMKCTDYRVFVPARIHQRTDRLGAGGDDRKTGYEIPDAGSQQCLRQGPCVSGRLNILSLAASSWISL